MAGDEDARIVNAASLSKQLVDRLLSERTRQVDLIATSPSVIAAARKGTATSKERGLPKLTINQLEQMFKAERSQQVDDGARNYLKDLLPKLDIAEVMVTDEYGYNAVTTSMSSDFVQSDEGWWQTAWASGHTSAQATADPATQRTVVELAAVISDHGVRVGVVKVKFGLAGRRLGADPGKRRRIHASRRPHRLARQGHRQLGSGDALQAVRRVRVGSLAATGTEHGVRLQRRLDAAAARPCRLPTNGGRWRRDRAHERSRCVALLLRRRAGAAWRRRPDARADHGIARGRRTLHRATDHGTGARAGEGRGGGGGGRLVQAGESTSAATTRLADWRGQSPQ